MSGNSQAAQPLKMFRGLKFLIYEVEGVYYLCSENKGADQLHIFHAADLCLFFTYAKNRFSHDAAHTIIDLMRGTFLRIFNT